MSRVTVVAKFVANPGMEAALEQLLTGLVAATRKEEGCITYDLHRDLTDPRIFVFTELWESREHLNAHSKSPHIAASRPKRAELVEESMLHVMEQIA